MNHEIFCPRLFIINSTSEKMRRTNFVREGERKVTFFTEKKRKTKKKKEGREEEERGVIKGQQECNFHL